MQHNKVGEQKLYKLFGRYSLVFFLVVFTLNAKSFENFKRSTADTYSKYKDKSDIEFAKYLKQQFKAYTMLKQGSMYEESKPSSLMKAIPVRVRSAGPIIQVNIPKYEEKMMMHHEKKDEIKDISFDFFGSILKYNIPQRLKSAKYYPQNQKGISNFFDVAASSGYQNLLIDIKQTCVMMNLNDWATYLLVNKISNYTFKNSDNAKLMTWFLFSKMGYSVKIGLISQHIRLMYHSKKVIYSKPSYKFKDKVYYILSDSSKIPRLYSYEEDYINSNKAFDLSLDTLPTFKENLKYKVLNFKSLGRKYEIKFSYNKNIIDFMATYPQADYETFFNAPLQDRTYADIASGLKKYLDKKQASSAINFVLNFVQNSFVYEVDKKQFGHEKVMFAQETLYYDKSDCEDRAVLFATLVKKIFGFSVVGVKYKDHMATALYIPMKGDSIMMKSKRYVIADPSFIDASIGQSMPKYKSVIPKSFVMLKKD